MKIFKFFDAFTCHVNRVTKRKAKLTRQVKIEFVLANIAEDSYWQSTIFSRCS